MLCTCNDKISTKNTKWSNNCVEIEKTRRGGKKQKTKEEEEDIYKKNRVMMCCNVDEGGKYSDCNFFKSSLKSLVELFAL